MTTMNDILMLSIQYNTAADRAGTRQIEWKERFDGFMMVCNQIGNYLSANNPLFKNRIEVVGIKDKSIEIRFTGIPVLG